MCVISLLPTADIPGEHKLVYLARRVMEADSRMVESILYNTKYSNLSNESKSGLIPFWAAEGGG